MEIRSVALDLGSTALKAGRLDASGRLSGVRSVPAPPLSAAGLVVEGDPVAYAKAAERLLTEVAVELPPGMPLAIATQRSSFLFWDRSTGRPRTPLVSWLDRRAADWCEARASRAEEVAAMTLLRLAPQYAGPKIARLLEESPDLRRDAERGESLFGTLETWLLWRATRGGLHATDLSVAARTLLVDPRRGDWSDGLLDLFRVPRRALPAILPSAGRSLPLPGGWTLAATLSDQAAAALGTLGTETGRILVNLGTGAFVLRPLGSAADPLPGYLVGPLLARPGRATLYAAEGPVNGIAAAWDRTPEEVTGWPETDPAPDSLCLPETAGMGAPHWRPRQTYRFEGPETRRGVLEGILFRVREVVEGLGGPGAAAPIVLAGGLARSAALASGLSILLGAPVHRAEEPEATLAGAAALAVGEPTGATLRPVVEAGSGGRWLRSKYDRWRRWLSRILEASDRGPGPRG